MSMGVVLVLVTCGLAMLAFDMILAAWCLGGLAVLAYKVLA
jgi:hypothetical protein